MARKETTDMGKHGFNWFEEYARTVRDYAAKKGTPEEAERTFFRLVNLPMIVICGIVILGCLWLLGVFWSILKAMFGWLF